MQGETNLAVGLFLGHQLLEHGVDLIRLEDLIGGVLQGLVAILDKIREVLHLEVLHLQQDVEGILHLQPVLAHVVAQQAHQADIILANADQQVVAQGEGDVDTLGVAADTLGEQEWMCRPSVSQ